MNARKTYDRHKTLEWRHLWTTMRTNWIVVSRHIGTECARYWWLGLAWLGTAAAHDRFHQYAGSGFDESRTLSTSYFIFQSRSLFYFLFKFARIHSSNELTHIFTLFFTIDYGAYVWLFYLFICDVCPRAECIPWIDCLPFWWSTLYADGSLTQARAWLTDYDLVMTLMMQLISRLWRRRISSLGGYRVCDRGSGNACGGLNCGWMIYTRAHHLRFFVFLFLVSLCLLGGGCHWNWAQKP